MEPLSRLPWPDRVGLAAAGVVTLAIVYLAAFSEPGAKLADLPGFAFAWVYFVMVCAGPVWAVARLIDFIIGGPNRRRKSQSSS